MLQAICLNFGRVRQQFNDFGQMFCKHIYSVDILGQSNISQMSTAPKIFQNILEHICPSVRLLFWTSGDIYPGCQNKGASLTWMICQMHTMVSSYSPLVRHLNSLQPAWQPSHFISIPFQRGSFCLHTLVLTLLLYPLLTWDEWKLLLNVVSCPIIYYGKHQRKMVQNTTKIAL